ncbi:hypothetical protein GCM10020218_067100 [Dactylosporangium vinaceum]
MNALRSGETSTAALPSGQPEPLAVTTLMLTSFGGGGVTGGAAGAASEDSSMAPAVTAWNMDPPVVRH